MALTLMLIPLHPHAWALLPHTTCGGTPTGRVVYDGGEVNTLVSNLVPAQKLDRSRLATSPSK